ncbi:hypothetical protein [Paenibacillus phocaensis]|uniref:hypothetical protein n=1 Tax=Paenibacillus phocaensis TaxID=1776378 RepID=UPI000839B4BA|nr:hypothetical protein [Paenibacillus phocaensis]
MSITIKACFNKQTKDSKKEQVQFYIKGDDEHKPELTEMTRSVVILSIEGVEQQLTAEFKKSSKDAKKTVLDFEVKGDSSAEKSFEFYKKAGHDVVLTITESDETLEEFEEHQKKYREGLRGKINPDGTVEVDDPNQAKLDFGEEDDPMAGVDSESDVLPY